MARFDWGAVTTVLVALVLLTVVVDLVSARARQALR
jgi:phosphonate transport system permease protein